MKEPRCPLCKSVGSLYTKPKPYGSVALVFFLLVAIPCVYLAATTSTEVALVAAVILLIVAVPICVLALFLIKGSTYCGECEMRIN